MLDGLPAVPFHLFDHPRGYVCCRAIRPLVLDGSLRDPSWRRAPWTQDFVDIEGSAKPRPRFRTRAKMLWDDDFFYIGAELEEPDVWATLTERDSVIFHDNDFEVFIDPDGDNHEYYELEINALNTVWDLRLPKPYRDGGNALNEWDIHGLKSAVDIRGAINLSGEPDDGWTVELAIPWKSLGEYAHCPAPPRHGDQWRVNFSRVEWQVETLGGAYRKLAGRREDNWVWSPQGVVDMHRPEMWGYVQFSTDEPGSVKFDPDPSWPARVRLHEVYYAQRRHRERTGRWGYCPEELGAVGRADVSLTADGYIAVTTYIDRDGNQRSMSIRQDSLVIDSV